MEQNQNNEKDMICKLQNKTKFKMNIEKMKSYEIFQIKL